MTVVDCALVMVELTVVNCVLVIVELTVVGCVLVIVELTADAVWVWTTVTVEAGAVNVLGIPLVFFLARRETWKYIRALSDRLGGTCSGGGLSAVVLVMKKNPPLAQVL